LLSSNTTGGAGDLAFGDFNNDGKKDLGVFDGADTNYFLLGNGDGSFSNFTASSPSAFGGYLTQLRIGDIDGNGYSDAFLNGGSAIVAFIASPSDTSSTTTTTTAALGSFSLTTASGALSALATLDAAMDKITATRGLVGSSLSRLDSALHTTQATKDNYEAAASRIHDADIGSEAANYVRLNLLQKTGAALLAHANQLPGLLLDLLRPD
jgi:flagellin